MQCRRHATIALHPNELVYYNTFRMQLAINRKHSPRPRVHAVLHACEHSMYCMPSCTCSSTTLPHIRQHSINLVALCTLCHLQVADWEPKIGSIVEWYVLSKPRIPGLVCMGSCFSSLASPVRICNESIHLNPTRCVS